MFCIVLRLFRIVLRVFHDVLQVFYNVLGDRMTVNNFSLLYILQKNDTNKHVDHVLRKCFCS